MTAANTSSTAEPAGLHSTNDVTAAGAGTDRWQFWIDRGGTFTDVVGRRPDGSLVTHKLLSENPGRYPRCGGGRHPPSARPRARRADRRRPVDCVKMGTTVATNALLERKGEPTLLVTTRGFRDALRIAYQDRPRLFDLHIVLPELLYTRVIEADERVGAAGDVVRPLDAEALRRDLEKRVRGGPAQRRDRVPARLPPHAHELAAEALARAIGFTQISVSHKVSPLMKLVSRGDTTVVDAYLSPILRRYVDQVAAEMPGVRLYFMQSSGGLTDAHAFQGKDAILSGPGRRHRRHGADRRDRPARRRRQGDPRDRLRHGRHLDRRLALRRRVRARVRDPGRRRAHARADDEHPHRRGRRRLDPRLRRRSACAPGPESAGANPGPACYRRGGPLTVTDANVMVGKIQPAWFPAVFGPDADAPLDREVVVARFTELAAEIARATGSARSPERSPRATSTSRSARWPTRSRRSRSRAATT
jgi:5-oxoprolinase (ATP-hydrolysing)